MSVSIIVIMCVFLMVRKCMYICESLRRYVFVRGSRDIDTHHAVHQDISSTGACMLAMIRGASAGATQVVYVAGSTTLGPAPCDQTSEMFRK